MIDYDKLEQAYNNESFYSLQLEVGDVCEQGCIYCYMNALEHPINTLSDVQIYSILDQAHNMGITAIEWLGGEPLLRNSIFEHMSRAADYGLRNNMWTGGLPFSDAPIPKKLVSLCRHGLISVHVSSVNHMLYQNLHPNRPSADLDIILNGIKHLLDAGYPSDQMLNSVTFTGLQSAEDMIETMDFFMEQFKIKTSLNVYHTYLRPGQTDNDLRRFIPAPDAVRRVYKHYARQWGVTQFPMNCVNKQYCSATVAVLCTGQVTPCATIRDPKSPSIHKAGTFEELVRVHHDELVFKPFRNPDNLPAKCRTCNLADVCFGCRSRAYAAGRGVYGKDPRCYKM